MLNISDKAKFELKKAGLLASLFLALFFLGFYVVNLLDIKSVTKQILPVSEEIGATDALKSQTAVDGINIDDFKDWAKANNLKGADVYNADPDGDGLPNYSEFMHGTDPNKTDTDGDGFSDKQEITNGYDPDAPGDAKPAVYVKIAKIGVDAPMVWSQSEVEKNMLADLEKGLSHFAKTSAPGENGNAIISGHSSNYVWAKGDYNYVFKNLSNLAKGDTVIVKTVQRNGKIITYKYQVTDNFISAPDDERIFANTDGPTLTLSTCWPVGTSLKRTIIKADLVK